MPRSDRDRAGAFWDCIRWDCCIGLVSDSYHSENCIFSNNDYR
jgi:hypothetical protein